MHSSLRVLSKRITIPRLSPTHTSARIIHFLKKEGDEVRDYDPLLILECSPDLKADAADRKFPDETLQMIVETNDEGILRNLRTGDEENCSNSDEESKSQWLKVGTPIGVIDDGDDIDGDWTWQSYLHEADETTQI